MLLMKPWGVKVTSPVINDDEAMICFYPPFPVAKKLAARGGLPVDDLHVTLMYLGRRADYKMSAWELQDRVMEFAQYSETPRLWHQGYGFFDNGAEKVLWASINGQTLHSFRDQLVTFMASQQVQSASQFTNYTPHISLKYCRSKPTVLPRRLFPGTWVQDNISLVIGDTRTDFNLKESDGDYFGF